MAEIGDLENQIKQLTDQVAGYRGAVPQLQEALRTAQAEAAQYKTRLETMGTQMQDILQRLPALEQAAKNAQRLEVLADHGDLLGSKAMRQLVLSSGIPDADLAKLLGDIEGELGDILADEEETPPPAPTDAAPADDKSKTEPAPAPKPAPQTPPPVGGHAPTLRTAATIKEEIRAAKLAQNIQRVGELSLELHTLTHAGQ